MRIFSKSAQVTIFILLGLVLLMSLGIFMYYAAQGEEKEITAPEIVDKAAFSQYVTSCLEATAEEVIPQVALQGGMYKPSFFKTWQGTDIEYWCYGEGTNQCINTLLTKEDIAEQIMEGIKEKIDTCLDMHSFEAQGYTVQKGVKEGTATIKNNEIEIALRYKIKVEKESEQVVIEDFQTTIPSELGMLYATAQLLLNKEAQNKIVDILDYEINHTNIKITKQKPYPGTIYTLKKENNDLLLQFAVQGIDIAAVPGEIILAAAEPSYGCCYVGIERGCYANTPRTTCEKQAGRYESGPCACQISEEQQQTITPETQCNDGECKNCGTRKHGESWCGYDGQVGEGKDAVGSRHTSYFCIDGEIQEEQCRDYREEICVEQETRIKNTKATKALCRPNRWQDCAACATETCCENTNERDCYWNEALAVLGAENQCVPYVPPGLKFWDFNGMEICGRANQETTCSGLSCSQEWVNAAAIACYSQADCGDYRNTEGTRTTNNFFTTDLKHDPDEEIYDWENTAEPITVLPLTIGKQKTLLDTPVAEAADILLEMLTSAYRFVNQWTDLTIPNYLNPFTKNPKIEIAALSFCLPWQAPVTKATKTANNVCDLCVGEENYLSCSAYKCHSLSKKCLYEEKDGYPTCTAITEEKEKPFTIGFDASKLPTAYSATETTLAIGEGVYAGYQIQPALTPYTLFSVGVTSTEEAVCRLDYTPELDGFDPPSFIIGTPEYTKEHVMTLRVPPQMTIPSRLKEGLNITTAEQIVAAFVKPEELLETYETRFPAVFTVYTTVTGNDLAKELEPYVNKMLLFIEDVEENYPNYKNLSTTLLSKFETGGYYLFVSCEDRYGNKEEQQFFIDLTIGNATEDTTAPSIVAFAPENNAMIAADAETVSLSLYTDEPAECRYDQEDKEYEEMVYGLTCKNDLYDLVSVAGGSYKCTTTIPVEIEEAEETEQKEETEETRVYFRCADHPEGAETYFLSVQYGNTSGVEGELYSDVIPEDVEDPLTTYAEYISITANNETNQTEIEVNAYLLSGVQATVFNTTYHNISLVLYTDEEECRVQTTDLFEEMDCSSTEEVEAKGRYLCKKELLLDAIAEYPSQEYEITCGETKTQNMNVASVEYVLQRSNGLEILSVSPGNNEEVDAEAALTITTTSSEGISCGYSLNDSLERIEMKKLDESIFTTTLSNLREGYQTVEIFCIDAYENRAEEVITFYRVS